MARIVEPLRQMGAVIDGRSKGRLARSRSEVDRQRLRPIEYASPISSAQVKSALLLAGLFVDGDTTVSEPSKRGITRNECSASLCRCSGTGQPGHAPGTTGADLRDRSKSLPISLRPLFHGCSIHRPGFGPFDQECCVNPTRTGILDVLASMGADVLLENRRERAGDLSRYR